MTPLMSIIVYLQDLANNFIISPPKANIKGHPYIILIWITYYYNILNKCENKIKIKKWILHKNVTYK